MCTSYRRCLAGPCGGVGIAPDLFEKLGAAQHLPIGAHQPTQWAELLGRQCDPYALDSDLVFGLIDPVRCGFSTRYGP
jgi:hypothetical protein